MRVRVAEGDLFAPRVRRIGYVPMSHHTTEMDPVALDGRGCIPGFVPDPLFVEQEVTLGPHETHAFWIDLYVPTDVQPGIYPVAVCFASDEEEVQATCHVRVAELCVTPRRDFPVTHWFYADALCDWYGTSPFDENFWTRVKLYMADLVEHGTDCQYVPLFTPPTDGVKRPMQLLRVQEPTPGRYTFDFSDVARWVALARTCGARRFEWTHLFTQWGAENALRVYRDNANPDSLLWPADTAATSAEYRSFLAQFLPAFHRFLESERLLGCSFFHVSDEPHGESHIDNYRAARGLLAEHAPWMQVMDALSDVRFAQLGLTDMPVAILSAAPAFAQAGIPAWVYYCCAPRARYVNRFLDTPLAAIRMTGWLLYRLRAQGFLHWGYNYWYRRQSQQLIDPFTEQAACAWPGWAAGDPFVVYPGPEGPIDSLRWELFALGLSDYALLQSAAITPDDPMLAPLIAYDDFPREPGWIDQVRGRILFPHQDGNV